MDFTQISIKKLVSCLNKDKKKSPFQFCNELNRIIIMMLTLSFVVLGVIGILDKMLMPLTPFTGPDSVGYLGVAFRYMTNHVFRGIAERSYPYPSFLTLIINQSKSVENVVLFQKILSILSAFWFYQILKLINLRCRLYRFDPYNIYVPVSLFFSLLIIFAPSQNLFEQLTHPEALTLPLVLFLIYSMLKLDRAVSAHQMLYILLWTFICIVFNQLIYVMQPRMTLGCLFLYAVIFFLLCKSRQKIFLKLAILLVPISSVMK